ncbi:MAG: ATP-grasp domain-containing protein [Leadbetterella sp.]
MKKIGILFGSEDSFSLSLIDRLNQERSNHEFVLDVIRIDKVSHDISNPYDLIIDRISPKIPFYASYIRNAMVSGTAVINNPLMSLCTDAFYSFSQFQSLGIPTPKFMLLPSKERPLMASELDFRNLAMPMDWQCMFSKVRFPLRLRPVNSCNNYVSQVVRNADEFWHEYANTGSQVMMLEEYIEFDQVYSCFVVGGSYAQILKRESSENEIKLTKDVSLEHVHKIELYALSIAKKLGYDLVSLEFGLYRNKVYIISPQNCVPMIEPETIGAVAFESLIDQMAHYCLERLNNLEAQKNNCTWGEGLKPPFKKKWNLRVLRQTTKQSFKPLHSGSV